MKFRVFEFCIAVLGVLVLIKFIPWPGWFQVGLTDQNRWLERVWEAILVTVLSLFVARKARLNKTGGFAGHKRASTGCCSKDGISRSRRKIINRKIPVKRVEKPKVFNKPLDSFNLSLNRNG